MRAFYRTWYRDLVTAVPEVKGGMITVPPGPGLGLELNPDLDQAFTTSRKFPTQQRSDDTADNRSTREEQMTTKLKGLAIAAMLATISAGAMAQEPLEIVFTHPFLGLQHLLAGRAEGLR